MAIPKITFSSLAQPSKGEAMILAGEDATLGPIASQMNADAQDIVTRAAATRKFKGKAKAAISILAPAGLDVGQLHVLGVGKGSEDGDGLWRNLGGVAIATAGKADQMSIVLEHPNGEAVSAEDAAEFALGALLRSYSFDQYKTKKDDDGASAKKPMALKLLVGDPRAARKAFKVADAVAKGVFLARDLVNEPANVLGPVEFAKRASDLSALGVEVEILGEKQLAKLKMNALLGVARGSTRPPRLAIMKWMKGGKKKPVVFVGKGVVFDTGGISIKPAGGMEDMKGDMGGAAAVTGVMAALAGRKAKTNAIGIIGLVENMPDGNAQRPGDIVTAMSGKTIEVINTDAEGRLVLADALHHACTTFDPACVIDLATLTGACIIALGHDHAGLLSNNDDLADQLFAAGQASGDKVWRLPLGPAYDKLIESKFADMKNVGGRAGGTITAAQFLQRFVGDVHWAHLDIAGTAMSSPKSDINTSWGSGFGVRLLDRFVADNYE